MPRAALPCTLECEMRTSEIERRLADLESKAARIKYGAAKALRMAAERDPKPVYPHFEAFERLLESPNNILRWNAILVLGNLAPADREGRLARILPAYLAPIAGPSLITAGNTIRGAAVIARHQPALAATIARAILGVEHASYQTPECRNVAIGHALEAFSQFFDLVEDKTSVVQFATRQLENTRPPTRRKAERLLHRMAFSSAPVKRSSTSRPAALRTTMK